MRIDAKTLSGIHIGRKIKSDYFKDQEHILRTVQVYLRNNDCSSGFMVWANGGELCPYCKTPPGTRLDGIDASWITFVNEFPS